MRLALLAMTGKDGSVFGGVATTSATGNSGVFPLLLCWLTLSVLASASPYDASSRLDGVVSLDKIATGQVGRWMMCRSMEYIPLPNLSIKYIETSNSAPILSTTSNWKRMCRSSNWKAGITLPETCTGPFEADLWGLFRMGQVWSPHVTARKDGWTRLGPALVLTTLIFDLSIFDVSLTL